MLRVTGTYQNGKPIVVKNWGLEAGVPEGDSPRKEEEGQNSNSANHQELSKK